jgi:hypothetical protein
VLIRAFPDHFECRAPGDEARLERLRATGRSGRCPNCAHVEFVMRMSLQSQG